MFSIINKYNKTIILVLSALLLTLFAYFTPPGNLSAEIINLRFYINLDGDLAQYINRFFLSSLLFGLIPLVFIFINKKGISSIGINLPLSNPFKDKIFLFLMMLCLFIGFISSLDSSLSVYYPYSKTLSGRAASGEWNYLLYHIFSYSLFYYLPWEIFFRGFLIFPFLSRDTLISREMTPSVMMLVSIQVIPSSIIHFGHPISETIGAIPFGILCGWLVVKYRSILPGLLLHILTGVSMDIFITLRKGGLL